VRAVLFSFCPKHAKLADDGSLREYVSEATP